MDGVNHFPIEDFFFLCVRKLTLGTKKKSHGINPETYQNKSKMF